MSRLRILFVVLIALATTLPATAQFNYGTAELGEIQRQCAQICFSTNPATCDSPGTVNSITAGGPFSVHGLRRGPSDQDLCGQPGLTQPATLPINLQANESLIFDIDLVADEIDTFNVPLLLNDIALTALQAEVIPALACPTNSNDALCLLDDRFTVRTSWRTDQGTRGPAAKVLDVESDDAALFYFFRPDNWEMLVKMVDACTAPFDSFWVFAAATTNVEYTLTVTDTQAQEVRIYTNPLGTPADPIQDTQAFATCP